MVTRILVLPGDGVGPEVMASALDVLDVVAITEGLHLDITEDVLHGVAWNKYRTFCRPETITNAKQSDAVLVGAVGGPEWDHITIEGGPTEQDGLMKLRMELEWKDRIDLEEGIATTIEWVDKNLDILKNLPDKYIHQS